MSKLKLLGIFSFILLLGIFLGSGFGQSFNNSGIAGQFSKDDQNITIQAVANARPAVVSVMVYGQRTFAVFDMVHKTQSTKTEKYLIGQGSGFLISSNGWILTNKHVVNLVKGKKIEIVVVLNNGQKYNAFLVDKDPFNDLAVLRILGHDFPYLRLAKTGKLPIGTTVLAIGNALGRYQNSVTKGIISGLGRNLVASDKNGQAINLDNVIQTDAEINHGNSGGPLINLDGEVVGINVAIDESGNSIGFAIPADDIRPVLNSIINYKKIIRPWLGVRYIMVNPQLVEERKLKRNNGALLIKSLKGEFAIAKNSPADKAGLQEGDIIFEINGVQLNKSRSLFSVIQTHQPGDVLTLKIQRGTQILTKKVVLEQFK